MESRIEIPSGALFIFHPSVALRYLPPLHQLSNKPKEGLKPAAVAKRLDI